MKCDELEKFDATSNADRSAGIESQYAYNADEVDEAIAEFKAEITRKEAVGQRWFARCMDARAENVRLKRALWIARAERAKTTQLLLKNAIDHLESKYKHRFDNMRLQFHVWGVVKRKCRAKAEEYK